MEQLHYNLLFRWFVGLKIDDPLWDHSTFSFNRQQLFYEAAELDFANPDCVATEIYGLVRNRFAKHLVA